MTNEIRLTEGLGLELSVGLTVPKILEEMEEHFPDRSPQVEESYGQLMYRGGQRSVVNWLKERLKELEMEIVE